MPDYCVDNAIGLQPLHVGERWRPVLGTLDRAQSNCMPTVQQQSLGWTITPDSAVDVTSEGELVGASAGEFEAYATNDAGETLLTLRGFVMPETYQLQPLPADLRLAVDEAYTLSTQAVGDNGQPLAHAWLFASPGDMSVLGQRGCLPRRPGAQCIVHGRTPGTTSLRVAVGRVSHRISVTVE